MAQLIITVPEQSDLITYVPEILELIEQGEESGIEHNWKRWEIVS